MFMRLAAAALLFFALPSFAQVGSSSKRSVRTSPTPVPTATPVASTEPVITVKDAVEQALKNNTLVRADEELVTQSRYQKFATRAGLLPSVDILGTAAKRKDSVADRLTGAVLFGGDSYNLYTVGIHAEQPLFAYGLFSASKRAGINEDISRKNLEITKRDTITKVVAAFYSTVYYENLVRILEEQERSMKEIVDISRRRVSLGGKRVDYLSSQTQLTLLRPTITTARNNLVSSTAQLAELMGLENVTTLRIGNSIPQLALKDVAPRIKLDQSSLPELERIRLQRESVAQARTISMGSHLPQLSLTGDYGFSNFAKSEVFDDASRSWQAALVLKIPIFSGFSSIAERRALVSQDVQLEINERGVRNAQSVLQITSKQSLESAETSLIASEEGARLAREALAEGRRDYSVGLIDFVNYNTLQTAQFKASTELLQNRYNAITAYNQYFTSTGQPLSTLVELLNQQPEKNQ